MYIRVHPCRLALENCSQCELTCVYQAVRNVSFSGNNAYVLYELPPKLCDISKISNVACDDSDDNKEETMTAVKNRKYKKPINFVNPKVPGNYMK